MVIDTGISVITSRFRIGSPIGADPQSVMSTTTTSTASTSHSSWRRVRSFPRR